MNADTLLRHDALIYGSDEAFVAATAPFVRAGLDAGDAVIAVTTEHNLDLLAGALDGAAEAVTFVDAVAWYRHPLHTITGYRDVLLERLAAGASQVRVIGEVQFGQTVDEQRDWVRYEAALNDVFDAHPAWILCPYDRRALPGPVVDHAARTHAHVWDDHGRRDSGEYLPPRVAAGSLPVGQQARGVLVSEMEINGSLADSRTAAREVFGGAGLGRREVDDLMVALTEGLTNALVHGRPPVRLRLYLSDSAVTCEVVDAGSAVIDPLAGFLPPTAEDAEGGRGLWLARFLSDRLEIGRQNGHTVLRLSKQLPVA